MIWPLLILWALGGVWAMLECADQTGKAHPEMKRIPVDWTWALAFMLSWVILITQAICRIKRLSIKNPYYKESKR